MILKLGEAGSIRLLISPQVLTEAEGALRRKAPHLLGVLTLLLDRSQVEVVSAPSATAIKENKRLTGHRGDAYVLAAARAVAPEYFVILHRQHFLDNQPLKDAVPFEVGTPRDFLAWYRARFSTS